VDVHTAFLHAFFGWAIILIEPGNFYGEVILNFVASGIMSDMPQESEFLTPMGTDVAQHYGLNFQDCVAIIILFFRLSLC
jgi:hypothetical protein